MTLPHIQYNPDFYQPPDKGKTELSISRSPEDNRGNRDKNQYMMKALGYTRAYSTDFQYTFHYTRKIDSYNEQRID